MEKNMQRSQMGIYSNQIIEREIAEREIAEREIAEREIASLFQTLRALIRKRINDFFV